MLKVTKTRKDGTINSVRGPILAHQMLPVAPFNPFLPSVLIWYCLAKLRF